LIGGEFFPERAHCRATSYPTIVDARNPLYGVPAFGDRLSGLFDDSLQRLPGFVTAIQQVRQVSSCQTQHGLARI
jgi:hypothetical protein